MHALQPKANPAENFLAVAQFLVHDNRAKEKPRMTRSLFLVAVGLQLSSIALPAQEGVNYARIGPPAGLVASDVKPASTTAVCFLEGPAVDRQGNVYFSD